MIALHITAQLEGKEVCLTVNRLRREDANKREAVIIDFIHDSLKMIMETVAEKYEACSTIEEIKEVDE